MENQDEKPGPDAVASALRILTGEHFSQDVENVGPFQGSTNDNRRAALRCLVVAITGKEPTS